MVRPVCFMVMPFGKKPTGVAAAGVPAMVNFDSLWRNAIEPALRDLEYDPVRADQDTGALIIKDMLERLAASHLIVADLTIPNGNVYYEVGFRHALQRIGCVLIAAKWSKPLFDMEQMRRLPYPLEHEVVEGEEAETIRDILRQNLQKYANAAGPAFEVMPDLPKIDEKKLSSFRDYVQQLSAFQAEVNAVRRRPAAEQTEPAKELVERYRNSKTPAVALELLYLVRDALTWADVVAFIDGLPPEIRQLSVVREQYCLALAETGKIEEAIGALEQLIADNGSTPEREGLLGGRFKKRYGKNGDPADLDRAIEHYERGMQLDLNAYYCSSNLPRLLRTRNDPDDEARAAAIAPAVYLACERAKALGTADEWLNPTLLVSAFDAGDVSAIAALTRKVRAEGHARWKLKTAIADAKTAIKLHGDAKLKEDLQTALGKLEALLPPEA